MLKERLLIAQGFDRVHAFCLAGRMETEEDPHGCNYTESQYHGLA